MTIPLYRRSRTLVAHWRGCALTVHDYRSNVRRAIVSPLIEALTVMSDWMPVRRIAAEIGASRSAAQSVVEQLLADGFVERFDRWSRHLDAFHAWERWAPEAAAFHFGTKDGRHIPLREATARYAARLEVELPPDPLKVADRRLDVRLAPPPRRESFARTLLDRRTWRRFGDGPITMRELSTLLGLTWAVQGWLQPDPRVRVPLKTSPSGGGCHSLEVYALVRRVSGVEPGIYRYAPALHGLSRIRRGLGARALTRYLNDQAWFGSCAAAFVMTSVFGRVQWKYPFPRAYRVILLEAGHFCQTFCLVATRLGLAPFCTASLADTRLERALRIDGVAEGVVYAAGVGRRPRGQSDRWTSGRMVYD